MANVAGLIGHDRELQTRVEFLQPLPQVVETLCHRVRNSDRVRASLLVDRYLDTLLAIDPRDDLALLVALVDLRHILQPDDRTLRTVDHHRVQVLGPHKLIDRPHKELGLTLAQPTASEVDVLLGQAIEHPIGRQTEIGQSALVERHLNLLLQPATDHHRRHTFDPLQRPLDLLFGNQAQAHQVATS